jgi:hypothetical protein
MGGIILIVRIPPDLNDCYMSVRCDFCERELYRLDSLNNYFWVRTDIAMYKVINFNKILCNHYCSIHCLSEEKELS